MARRTVTLETLPGGSGKALIHLFVFDKDGACTTRAISGKRHESDAKAPSLSTVRGYVACQPQRKTISASLSGGKHHAFPVTVDPRAANCPSCLATAAAVALLASNTTPPAAKET